MPKESVVGREEGFPSELHRKARFALSKREREALEAGKLGWRLVEKDAPGSLSNATEEDTLFDVWENTQDGRIERVLVGRLIRLGGKGAQRDPAIVSPEDYEQVRGQSWWLERGYAATTLNGRQRRNITMGPFVLEMCRGVLADSGEVCDHKDGRKLDNRRENIHWVSREHNNRRRGRGGNSTSGRVGVTWHSAQKKWRSRLAIRGREVFVRYFDYNDLKLASEAYEKAKAHMHGVDDFRTDRDARVTFNFGFSEDDRLKCGFCGTKFYWKDRAFDKDGLVRCPSLPACTAGPLDFALAG